MVHFQSYFFFCDVTEMSIQHHISYQAIICLWNRIFLFVFNHSQWDVCLILSLRITLLRLCVCVCTMAARCLNIETFIVMLSLLSEWREIDIGLRDSQRSGCRSPPPSSGTWWSDGEDGNVQGEKESSITTEFHWFLHCTLLKDG